VAGSIKSDSTDLVERGTSFIFSLPMLAAVAASDDDDDDDDDDDCYSRLYRGCWESA